MANRVTIYADTSIRMARYAGLHPVMDEAAQRVLSRAVVNATTHIDTSAYIRSLYWAPVRGRRGVMDREVGSTDPGALAIEYGHAAALGRGKEGPRRWVEGQHILGRAAFE